MIKKQKLEYESPQTALLLLGTMSVMCESCQLEPLEEEEAPFEFE